MKLKLKDGLENTTIYVPFENRDILGKFIDERLYPYMYDKYPSLFDIIEDKPKKTTKTNDTFISNTIIGSNSDIKGESI
jgi:hypothetical protein